MEELGTMETSIILTNTFFHHQQGGILNIQMFHENKTDEVFRAETESVEEAILNSMITAETTYERDGHIRHSLKE